ncbi:hypothetical protein WJ438_38070 [Streptomyces sp. GD-15H]|uniref:hypothetical protein n=1 Tax=Streptomyces sp. GD-15H TaxID=3129112 RepID=UPI003252B286
MNVAAILVSEEILASREASVRADLRQRPVSVDVDNVSYGPAFRHYWLLTHMSSLIAKEAALSGVTLFYNRYFWFARFTHLFSLSHGPDAGLEQQLFQMLEHPPVELNWAVVEEIDVLARQ